MPFYNNCLCCCTGSNPIFMIHLTHNRLASSPRYLMISISSCHIMWILSRWSGVIIVTPYNYELIATTIYPKLLKQNISSTAHNLMWILTIYCYTTILIMHTNSIYLLYREYLIHGLQLYLWKCIMHYMTICKFI